MTVLREDSNIRRQTLIPSQSEGMQAWESMLHTDLAWKVSIRTHAVA
jgi:hypothetical protein